jgi:hypothetical protein
MCVMYIPSHQHDGAIPAYIHIKVHIKVHKPARNPTCN